MQCAGGPFFLDIEAPARAWLGDLDAFLRRIWLECCGHMSWFTDPDVKKRRLTMFELMAGAGEPELKMETRLSAILRKGKCLHYTYDAGSSTDLSIRVAAEEKVPREGGAARLLARNNAPRNSCSCGGVVESICTECMWSEEEEYLLCAACAGKHDCGEEMLLPLVNSPRAGVCGYTGPDEDEWD